MSAQGTREGKVITARCPVDPRQLGAVLMHEHLHCDFYDWERGELVAEERLVTPDRRRLLMEEAAPHLAQCTEHGCRGLVEASPPPYRAWPTFYAEVSEATGVHIVLCTGCYREIETGTYFVRTPEDAIWPFAVAASLEELEDCFVRELLEGINGTTVRAGAIKLAASVPELTDTERKAFRAGARAQRKTGVHVTTHCTAIGGETTQLRLLEREGVELDRVVIGHAGAHLMDRERRRVCMDWMRRGANFMPTNLAVRGDGHEWRPLVEAIHEVFDAGLGRALCLSLDWAFSSESGPLGPCSYMPPPPFLHMFTHVLPCFRELGLTEAEIEAMTVENPARILPVQ